MPHALDPGDMESIISQSPGQFQAGLDAAKGATVAGGPFTSVLLAGMGGSWMAGALVRDAKLARVPIHIHRDYGLPDPLKLDRPLVIASTYSGNTQETLTAYEAARERGLPLAAITCGGRLAAMCKRDGTTLVTIPADPPHMQPRSATGYTVGILTRLLDNLGLAAEGAVAAVEGLGKPLAAFVEAARQHARRLLPGLRQATPVIYSSPTYATVAQIFKIKINEHAKTPAFWNVFPELNHNEMVGWTQRRGAFHIIFLRDEADSACVLKRMSLAREILSEHGVSSAVVPIEGQNLVEKIFRTLLVADWAAYELALAGGFDPSPVHMVEDFKRRLSAIDKSC